MRGRGRRKNKARGRFMLCVNHCEGKTERQKGQGAGLMRWKQSTWQALFLSLAEPTSGPTGKERHRQEGADLRYTAATPAGEEEKK